MCKSNTHTHIHIYIYMYIIYIYIYIIWYLRWLLLQVIVLFCFSWLCIRNTLTNEKSSEVGLFDAAPQPLASYTPCLSAIATHPGSPLAQAMPPLARAIQSNRTSWIIRACGTHSEIWSQSSFQANRTIRGYLVDLGDTGEISEVRKSSEDFMSPWVPCLSSPISLVKKV